MLQYLLNTLVSFVQSNFSIIARLPGIFTSMLGGAGLLRFLQLRFRNRRLKIRTVELSKLRPLMEHRPEEMVYVRCVEMRIGQGNSAYHITVPSIQPGGPEMTVCVYSRKTLPVGYYLLEFLPDSVKFHEVGTRFPLTVALFTGELASPERPPKPVSTSPPS